MSSNKQMAGLVLLLTTVFFGGGYGARGFDACTKHSDCNYDGGKCWTVSECSVGRCLCAPGSRIINGTICKEIPKYGDEMCQTNDDCNGTDICKDGSCGCRAGDSVLSADKYSCHRRNGESCSGDDQCLPPQTCVNQICSCPLNTAYATYDLAGFVDSEKCIPSGQTSLNPGDVCDPKSDFCGNHFTCGKCVNNSTTSICISEFAVKPDSAHDTVTTSESVTITQFDKMPAVEGPHSDTKRGKEKEEQKEEPPCPHHICENGGTCHFHPLEDIGDISMFTCTCAPGYTGHRCEVSDGSIPEQPHEQPDSEGEQGEQADPEGDPAEQAVIQGHQHIQTTDPHGKSGTDHVIMIAWVVGSISLIATAVFTFY